MSEVTGNILDNLINIRVCLLELAFCGYCTDSHKLNNLKQHNFIIL